MSLTEARRPATTGRAAPPAEADVRVKPVMAWALVGGFFVLFQMFVFSKWILGGNASPTPTGSTPVPEWMKYTIRGWEVVSTVILIVFLYYVLVRPWRRTGRITSDGLMCIAATLCVWRDQLLNFVQVTGLYNSYALNLGSWYPDIPGWISPQGRQMLEPMWVFQVYAYMVLGGAMVGCFVMRKTRARWPQLNNIGLVLVCFGVTICWDLIIEIGWLRLGLYMFFPIEMNGIVLFEGHYYAFPLYESVLLGLLMTIWACIRYFRDDRGLTFAERGVEKLNVSPRKQTGLRLLALTGLFNLVFILSYDVPWQIFAVNANNSPADITNRSYLTHGVCGVDTDRACPSGNNPMPRRGGPYINQQGELVR